MHPAHKVRKTEHAESKLVLHENVGLTPCQREALECVVNPLDTDTASVVITNPLQHDNPIVFVTKPWEEMCGYTYSEAVGRNARITQGQHSDPAVMRRIGGALRSERSCKVLTLNYRGGHESRPFWNMLSISPIHHKGQLVLYLANLQDYTYHMGRLVSLPPTQFCRSAQHHQRIIRLGADGALKRDGDTLDARFFARPAIIETADVGTTALATAAASADTNAPHLHMKRLGWSNLTLEPEHLTDRVVDALHALEARYERVEPTGGEAENEEVFVVNAEITGVAVRLVVTRDPDTEGGGGACYRVTCTRLGGDTFVYHDAFRQLRTLLGDAVQGGKTLMGGGGMTPAARLRALAGGGASIGQPMGLAPLPDWTCDQPASRSPPTAPTAPPPAPPTPPLEVPTGSEGKGASCSRGAATDHPVLE